MFGIINYTVLVLVISTFLEVHGQRERGRSLVVVSKHEPTKTKDAAPKSQQTLVVSPRMSNTILSRNSVDRVMFPSQLFSNFLPRGILSDHQTAKEVAPTAISPIVTTSSGSQFGGMTQSILQTMVQKVKQEAENQMNLMKSKIQKELTMDPKNIHGILKATAEQKIKEILSSALGDMNNGILHNKNTAVLQKGFSDKLSVTNEKPNTLSLQSLNPMSLQSSSWASLDTRPLVLARQPLTATRPLVLAPNPPRAQASQRDIQLTATRTQQERPTIVNQERLPAVLHPSRMRSTGSLTRTVTNGANRVPTISRTVTPRRQSSRSVTLRAQTSRNAVPVITSATPRRQTTRTRQSTTVQRRGGRTLTIRRQQTSPTRTRQSNTPSDAAVRASRCPAQSSCRRVVPASCRRPAYITDDNGRRICRGCDEDRCEFAGFEQRWGRGFG